MKMSAHLSWAATLSMPAWEQSSSLPGDPDRPTVPTTSSPTLIGRPPDNASTRAGGFVLTRRRQLERGAATCSSVRR
jgi:hypothetical protein